MIDTNATGKKLAAMLARKARLLEKIKAEEQRVRARDDAKKNARRLAIGALAEKAGVIDLPAAEILKAFQSLKRGTAHERT